MKKLIELLDAARSEAAKLQKADPRAEITWLEENYNIPRMRHDMSRFGHLLCWTQDQQNAYHRYVFLTKDHPIDGEKATTRHEMQQELTRLRRKYDISGMEVSMLARGHLDQWQQKAQDAYRRVEELKAEIAKPVTETLSIDVTYLEAMTLRELLRRVVPEGFCANPRDAVHMTSAIKKIVDELDEMLDEE